MKTSKQIINYIKWNKLINKKNKSKYKIGYYDRVDNNIKFFYFSDIIFKECDEFALAVKGSNIKNDKIIYIPYHRLRIVYDNSNKIIWKRKK